MNEHLSYRKASRQDLPRIVELLLEDDLGKTREQKSLTENDSYHKAFELIEKDPNQFLMVIEMHNEIVGTCHLTLMPSLTLQGSLRLNIEAVRVSEKLRGQKIGEWMMEQVKQFAMQHGVKIIQLTTNKTRARAHQFYEKLGFKASHEGMKLSL